MDSLKKRLCNPPAERVAAAGDPEVLGLFEGAGDGLAYAFEEGEKKYHEACQKFERAVVTCEAAYIQARKDLAESTANTMKAAINEFAAATGGGGYGGG